MSAFARKPREILRLVHQQTEWQLVFLGLLMATARHAEAEVMLGIAFWEATYVAFPCSSLARLLQLIDGLIA